MIFAIDLSTRRGEIALATPRGELIAARQWDDPTARHTNLWVMVDSLAREAIPQWEAVSLFAVGRGPGSYSGLRAALIAARMLAAPGNAPVCAINSGAPLALAWYEQHADQTSAVAVAGDARRGHIWCAVFERRDALVCQLDGWFLVPASEFASRFAGIPVISSDPARLAAASGIASDSICLSFPTASALARIAAASAKSEPLEPLYLHPPV